MDLRRAPFPLQCLALVLLLVLAVVGAAIFVAFLLSPIVLLVVAHQILWKCSSPLSVFVVQSRLSRRYGLCDVTCR
jgi:hypothetical protein